MSRRLLVVLASVVAVGAGGTSAFLATRSGGSDAATAAPKVALLSPRRTPELLHRLVAETRVASRVDAVMRSVGSTSCAVVHAGESRVVNVRPNELLIPASALKLTTAAAFLSKVGGTGTFTTGISYPKPSGGVVRGDVVLEGGGDPLLATAGYVETRKRPPKPFTDFNRLVAVIREDGVRHITGGIGVYDGYYDAERRVPSWSPGYTATGDVGPIGALAVDDGFSAYTPQLVAAPDPALAAGSKLRSALIDAGITVDGPVARRAQPLRGGFGGDIESAPFAEVVGEMLRESDNNTAELLLKELARRVSGAPGTRAKGVEARNEALFDMGLNTNDIQAIDGSGLDRSDRATCDALVTTLTTRPGGYDLVDMLPTAGRTGTLDDRFTTSPLVGKLRAKTGSLNNVTALVGVTDPRARETLRFAFVVNGAFSDAGGKALQDRFVAALATYPEAPPAAALAF